MGYCAYNKGNIIWQDWFFFLFSLSKINKRIDTRKGRILCYKINLPTGVNNKLSPDGQTTLLFNASSTFRKMKAAHACRLLLKFIYLYFFAIVCTMPLIKMTGIYKYIYKTSIFHLTKSKKIRSVSKKHNIY